MYFRAFFMVILHFDVDTKLYNKQNENCCTNVSNFVACEVFEVRRERGAAAPLYLLHVSHVN